MKLRLYISTFIITLTLLGGTLCNEQTVVPNQEIVLQFIDANIASKQAQNTIAIVKKQLKTLGANNIQVTEIANNGELKITYYSDSDVLDVEKILSKENNIELDFASNSQDEQSKIPLDKNTKIFNLDVYKIQDNNDTNTGFDGKLAIELKPETDRFFNPIVNNFAIEIDDRERDRIIKVAFKLNKNIAIAIDNTSHNIPEVRAGPVTI